MVSRRSFLTVAATAIIAGVVAGAGGYMASQSAAPPGAVTTKTVNTAGGAVTTTVTSPPTTVTSPPTTVTSPPTTVTSPPITTTVTGTVQPLPPPRDAIIIGSSASLSGPEASLSQSAVFANDLAEKDINAKGGVYVKEYDKNFPIKILTYDDTGDTAKALSNYERVISYDKANFVLGGGGPQTLPVLQTSIKLGAFIVGGAMATRTIWSLPYPYVFSAFFRIYEAILNVMTWSSMQPTKPVKTVASIEVDSDEGLDTSNSVDENQAKLGYKVVFRQKYTSGTRDWTDYILKLKIADPDVVDGIASPPDFIGMLKQCQELNYNPRHFQIIQAPEAWQYAQNIGRVGEYVSTPMPWNQDWPVGSYVSDAFFTQFGFFPFAHTPIGYQVFEWTTQAITAAGTFRTDTTANKDLLREVLLTKYFDTSLGVLKFQEEKTGGGSTSREHGIIQWLYNDAWKDWRGGPFQRLTTWVQEHPEWATTPFVYPMPAWKDRVLQ